MQVCPAPCPARAGAGDSPSHRYWSTDMSAEDLIRTARNDTYAGRVAMLQLKVAQNVASEDPNTVHHAERISYSYFVIRGDENPKMVAAHVNTNPVSAAA